MPEEKGLGEQVVDMSRTIWRHRQGNDVKAAILDTLDTLWPKAELRPIISNPEGKILERMWKNRKNKGAVKSILAERLDEIRAKKKLTHTFAVCLPPGISYADFKDRERYFSDAANSAVLIEKSGSMVIMKIMTERLKSRYPYKWDYTSYSKMYLPIPFGYSAAGFIVKDLSDAPNLIEAGHPGSGKSNFLHIIAVSLLLARSIHLIIIDLKKLEFSYLKEQALVISDMANAKAVLRAINRELDKRLNTLEKAGVVKIQDYHGDMKFIVLIIDELAEMQDKECQELLNRILRLGRAAGICVVCATQRPSSTIFQKFGDSKAMFSATVCFHVRDGINSKMILDNDAASLIPNIPGRAIYQWDRELEIQTMFLSIKQAKELLSGVKGETIFEPQHTKMLPPR